MTNGNITKFCALNKKNILLVELSLYNYFYMVMALIINNCLAFNAGAQHTYKHIYLFLPYTNFFIIIVFIYYFNQTYLCDFSQMLCITLMYFILIKFNDSKTSTVLSVYSVLIMQVKDTKGNYLVLQKYY